MIYTKQQRDEMFTQYSNRPGALANDYIGVVINLIQDCNELEAEMDQAQPDDHLRELVAELRRLLDIEQHSTQLLRSIIKDSMTNKSTWVGGPK